MKKFDWKGFIERKFVVSTKSSLESKDLVESYNEYLAKNKVAMTIEVQTELQEKLCYWGFAYGSFVSSYNVCNEEHIVPWSEYMEDKPEKEDFESLPFFLSVGDLLNMDGKRVFVDSTDFPEIFNSYYTVDAKNKSLKIEGRGFIKFASLESGLVNVLNKKPSWAKENVGNKDLWELLAEKKEIKSEDEKSKNIRRTILEAAISAVCGDREDKYGKPEKSFGEIAKLWSSYLDVELTGKDVAVMMCLFKIARIKTGTNKADNYIDLAGYAANAAELDGEQ